MGMTIKMKRSLLCNIDRKLGGEKSHTNFVESGEAGGTKASKVKILFYGKSSDEFKC